MSEFLLFCFYFFFFLFIIRKHPFFLLDAIPKYWQYALFVTKILVGFLLYFIYTKYYPARETADIFKYFDDSKIIAEAFWHNPKDFFQLVFLKAPETDYFFVNYYEKMNHWAHLHHSTIYGDSTFMIRINALLNILSLGNFHIHSLWFTMFSYTGLTAIYKGSISYFKKQKFVVLLLIFCMPSVLFWSSSLLKESLVLLLVGFIYLLLTKLKHQTKFIIHFSIISLLLFFLVLLKFYLVVAIIIPLVAFITSTFLPKVSPFLIYPTVGIVFLVLFFNLPITSTQNLLDILVLKQKDFIALAQQNNAGSYFPIPILEPNFYNILKNTPTAILNSFVQPIPSTTIKLMAIPAIAENTILLFGLFSILKLVIKKEKWGDISTQNWLLFLITFTLCLYTIIGLTTPIAGALVRYKVAVLPFLTLFIFYFIQKTSWYNQIIK